MAAAGLEEARRLGRDVLIVDTAGRLQNRTELMSELEKVVRVIKKVEASAPHAVLLVLDATGVLPVSQIESLVSGRVEARGRSVALPNLVTATNTVVDVSGGG